MRKTYNQLIKFFVLLSICFSHNTLLAEEQKELTPPKLVILEDSFDFGTVKEGNLVEKKYEFFNDGGSSLTINRVVTTCGCTASKASAQEIAPGEKGTIDVSFDSTGFEGRIEKGIRIYSNDPSMQMSVLHLSGEVKKSVSIEPSRVDFGSVSQGGGEQKSFSVKTEEGTGFEIISAKTFSRWLAVEREGTNTFNIKFLKGAPLGQLRSRVVVRMKEREGLRTLNVPIFALVEGELQVKPSLISFGVIEKNGSLSKNLRVSSNPLNKIRKLAVEVSHSSVKAQVSQSNEDNLYDVLVSVDPATIDKDLRSTLSIIAELESGAKEKVLVNVYGVLPPKA